MVVVKLFGRFFGGIALLIGASGAGVGIALLPIASSPASAATTLVVNDANDRAATPGNCTTPLEMAGSGASESAPRRGASPGGHTAKNSSRNGVGSDGARAVTST